MTGPRVISKKILHQGFSTVYDYRIEVPSQREGCPPHEIKREVMITSDSVVVLIYAPDIDSFLFGQEFRSGVFLNAAGDNPFILQCVAGMLDKNKSPEDTVREEVREEAGLDVDRLEHVASVYSTPGRITEKSHIYLARVKSIPRTGTFGLPEEGEEIVTRLIRRDEVYRMMDKGEIIDSMTFLALSIFRSRH